jgi:hypothetical protein
MDGLPFEPLPGQTGFFGAYFVMGNINGASEDFVLVPGSAAMAD